MIIICSTKLLAQIESKSYILVISPQESSNFIDNVTKRIVIYKNIFDFKNEDKKNGYFAPFCEIEELKKAIIYPEELRSTNIEGNVFLKVLFNKNGKIENITKISSDNQLFTEAAANALKNTKFKPAKDKGKPVNASLIIRFCFIINDLKDISYEENSIYSNECQSCEIINNKLEYEENQLYKNLVFPEILRRASGEYPVIILKVCIDNLGQINEIGVIHSDAEICNQSAFDAIKKTIFKSGVFKKEIKSCWIVVPIIFVYY